MARRFGRNRRRALREQVEGLKRAHQLDRGLLAHMRGTVDRLRAELTDAARILGPHTVAMPAAALVRGKGAALVHLPRADFDPLGPGRMQRVPLPVLASRVARDELGIHVRLTWEGHAWGYAMTREAVINTPPDLLAERVAREIAFQIADDLKRAYT